MSKAEIAEAIIVVGPYLWKCVNCDLLYSRQHSIDDHILSQHKSCLLQDRRTNVRCKLSICSCQKLPGVALEKKTRKVNKNKRKSIEGDTLSEEGELCGSSKHHMSSSFLAHKSSSNCEVNHEDPVENVMNQCNPDPSETDGNNTTLEGEEENYMEVRTSGNSCNEEEQTFSETELLDESENKTDCERQCSEDIICHDKEQFPFSPSDSADIAVKKEYPEDSAQTFLRKDDLEESAHGSPKKDDLKESAHDSPRKDVLKESAHDSPRKDDLKESAHDSPRKDDLEESAHDSPRKDDLEESAHDSPRKDDLEESAHDSPRKDDLKESVHDSPRKDDFEESTQVSVRKDGAEEMRERGMKRLHTVQENQSTRKSRRSNKGKNSLYQEFEMGLSKNV